MSNITYKLQENLNNYVCSLTPQEQEKARVELKEENAQFRTEKIHELVRMVQQRNPVLAQFFAPQLTHPVYLLRFLRGSKYRMEKAYGRLEKWLRFYHPRESSWPQLTAVLREPNNRAAGGGQSLIDFIRDENPIFACPDAGAPHTKNQGTWVFITDPPEVKHAHGMDHYTVMVVAQMIYIIDKLLMHESFQVHGMFSLKDGGKVNKNNTAFITNPSNLKRLITTLTGLPVRQKGDISTNSGFILSMIVKMITPALPGKMRQRLITLDKSKGLNTYLDIAKLTTAYGGAKSARSDCMMYLTDGKVGPTLDTTLGNVAQPVKPQQPVRPSQPSANWATFDAQPSRPLPPRPTQPTPQAPPQQSAVAEGNLIDFF